MWGACGGAIFGAAIRIQHRSARRANERQPPQGFIQGNRQPIATAPPGTNPAPVGAARQVPLSSAAVRHEPRPRGSGPRPRRAFRKERRGVRTSGCPDSCKRAPAAGSGCRAYMDVFTASRCKGSGHPEVHSALRPGCEADRQALRGRGPLPRGDADHREWVQPSRDQPATASFTTSSAGRPWRSVTPSSQGSSASGLSRSQSRAACLGSTSWFMI